VLGGQAKNAKKNTRYGLIAELNSSRHLNHRSLAKGIDK